MLPSSFLQLAIHPSTGLPATLGHVGAALLPGSSRVLDRSSGNLVDCDQVRCPFATQQTLVRQKRGRGEGQGQGQSKGQGRGGRDRGGGEMRGGRGGGRSRGPPAIGRGVRTDGLGYI